MPRDPQRKAGRLLLTWTACVGSPAVYAARDDTHPGQWRKAAYIRSAQAVRSTCARNGGKRLTEGMIMAEKLSGKKVAILAADGFEEAELMKPRAALEEAGAITTVVSIKSDKIQGMKHADKGETIAVDQTLDRAKPEDFDALLIPGGLMNPDTLRSSEEALEFVRHFFREGKPVAAICHAPWVLIDANVIRGRTVTSWPAIKTDVRNAGGNWVDQEVVVDNGLVTSRKPDDIPAFNQKMIEEFCEGRHAGKPETGSADLET
jgi:deglycase